MENPVVEAHFRKDAKPDWHQLRRRRAIMALFEGLEGRALDYGCGWGDLAYQIDQLPGITEVIGVDVDPERVAFAQQEYQPIKFETCPTDGLQFDDESFDVACSSVVVHFVPDPAHYFKELHRVLKPNGQAVVMTRGEEKVRAILRKMVGKKTSLQEEAELYRPTATEFEQLLGDCGFVIEKRNFFYDPPFDGWNSARALVTGVVEQICWLFNVRSTAPYLGYLVRKT